MEMPPVVVTLSVISKLSLGFTRFLVWVGWLDGVDLQLFNVYTVYDECF